MLPLPDRISEPTRLCAAVAVFSTALVLCAGPAGAQSFDCKKAYYPDEKTICQDPRLGQLDQQLASIYGRDIDKLPRDERSEIEQNETAFVKARRQCKTDRRCIEGSYRNRIEEIQEALAERGPDRPDRSAARRSDTSEPAQPPRARDASAERRSGAETGMPVESQSVAQPANQNEHSTAPTTGTPGAAAESSEREIRPPIASQARVKRHVPKKRDTATASAAPPRGEPAASSQPAPQSGSSGWVNPPPER